MKFFDYKFLILLGLTLVVYFLYREVEIIKNKLKKYDLLEDKKVKNETENEGDDSILQIELPPNPDDIKVEESKPVEENVKKIINIPLNLNKDSKTDDKDNKELDGDDNNENDNDNDNDNNMTSSNSEVDVNVYSNTSEKLEIYSNDDEDDNDSSVIISLEDIPKKKTKMESSEGSDNRLNEKENNLELNDSEEIKVYENKDNNENNENNENNDNNEDNDEDNDEDNNSLDEDDIKSSINNLLKNNKLAELQDKAKSLGIIITKKEKNKNKNKTKLELAKDIVNKKNN